MNESLQLERASRAKQLLEDPILIEGFDLVRAGIMQRWELSPIRDRDGAHELKLMLKLLADVRAALAQAVNDGKIVQFNHKQKLMDRVKGVLGVNV